MRIIDADALAQRMCRKCNVEMSDEPCEPDDCFVRNVIMDCPTIEAEPVKHGRWVEKEDAVIHCSECDRVGNPRIDNFCPNCGRKMEIWSAKEIEPWCEECVFFKAFGMDGEGECEACDPPQETWYGNSACSFFSPRPNCGAKMDLE